MSCMVFILILKSGLFISLRWRSRKADEEERSGRKEQGDFLKRRR